MGLMVPLSQNPSTTKDTKLHEEILGDSLCNLVSSVVRLLWKIAYRLPPRKQRQLAPFPMAIDVDKTDLAEPSQLGFHFEEFV